jgi:hypothetical protein
MAYGSATGQQLPRQKDRCEMLLGLAVIKKNVTDF